MVQKQKRKIKNRRDWLNKDKTAIGHISLDATADSCHSEKGIKRWGKKVISDISLTVADCTRHVTLEFETGREGWSGKHNKAACKRSITKAKLLRSYVNDIIEELEREV